MFYGVVANGTHINGLLDCALHNAHLERLQKAQDLDVFSLSWLAHSGLKQPVQRGEDIRKVPTLQRGSLIQSTHLLFKQGQKVQWIKDHIR
jgi:hypothetical protein|tara:strand:- start:19 stop:291 length:273 start_codon:yes stop_codon:yes gene_type:complete